MSETINFSDSKDWISLAQTCKELGKARSTLMRLLPSWEGITSYKPRKDHSGRWFIPVKSVEDLKRQPELYLMLAGRATKWSVDVAELKRENRKLRKTISRLQQLYGNFLIST
jgi:hypothetical protein